MGAIFTAEDSKEIRDGKLTGDWGRHWLCNSSAQGPVTKSTSENKMHTCHLNPLHMALIILDKMLQALI